MSQVILHSDVVALLRRLEWTGTAHGQGSGYMGSGQGPAFSACPVCRGLEEPNGHFNKSAVGHRPACKLADVLRRTEEAGWK